MGFNRIIYRSFRLFICSYDIFTSTRHTKMTMAKSVGDVNISAASSSTSSSPIAGITTFVQVRRSIVLDAEDQCMQLALAVYKKPIQQLRIESDNDGSIRSSTEYLRVQICLLSMGMYDIFKLMSFLHVMSTYILF